MGLRIQRPMIIDAHACAIPSCRLPLLEKCGANPTFCFPFHSYLLLPFFLLTPFELVLRGDTVDDGPTLFLFSELYLFERSSSRFPSPNFPPNLLSSRRSAPRQIDKLNLAQNLALICLLHMPRTPKPQHNAQLTQIGQNSHLLATSKIHAQYCVPPCTRASFCHDNPIYTPIY